MLSFQYLCGFADTLKFDRLLMYRYGLQSLQFRTIAETAAFFNLTEKHMRLIEDRALRKLREGMNDGKIV